MLWWERSYALLRLSYSVNIVIWICNTSFEVVQVKWKVSQRVVVARPTTVPAGEIRVIPPAWEEIPKDRTFACYGSVDEAVNGLVDRKTSPGIVIMNNTNKDVQYHAKQNVGKIEDCHEDEFTSPAVGEPHWEPSP